MRYVSALFVALLATTTGLAQTTPPSATEQAAMVNFAQKAIVRALDHKQGDRESLMDAQEDFTPDGWREFMKHLDGWLDDQGAPTFTANFAPSEKPSVMSPEGGTLSLTIPGRLVQGTRNAAGGVSTTTYRAEIDVRVSRHPTKIEHLQQTTCGARPCNARVK